MFRAKIISEIREIENSKTETYWECQTCMSDKFPFTAVENKVIVQNTFSSSFPANAKHQVNMVVEGS